jgi:hypothetical protein
MENKTRLLLTGVVIYILGIVSSCTKPYNPPAINSPGVYLVVEGVISDTTIIRLSNTVNLSSSAAFQPVLGAKVVVQGNAGATFPLTETGNGYYKVILNLSTSNTYQLKITTANNVTYASDLVPVKNSAAIDSVNYLVNGGNVQINANTHDPSNNSRYYRWTFNETYVIRTPFNSGFELQQIPSDTVVFRPFSQQVNECWVTDSSSSIILGSSAKLAKDVISMQPITTIPLTAEKLTYLYSIQVTQYVLTSDAFNYWQQLQKNTEQLGSIFDAQPSQLTGNIHCTSNPAEVAIGYISAGAVSQKRLFIAVQNLPPTVHDSPYGSCMLDTFLYKYIPPGSKQVINQVADNIYPGYDIPVTAIAPPGSTVILGYSGSSPTCVDCTLRGTNIKPVFWPY